MSANDLMTLAHWAGIEGEIRTDSDGNLVNRQHITARLHQLGHLSEIEYANNSREAA